MDEIVDPENLVPGFSRRTALLGAGGIAALLALGQPLLTARPAFAAAPTTADEAAALALSQVGKTLAQLQSTVMTDGRWGTFQGDWCAVFVSWLVRGTGSPYEQLASAAYTDHPQVSSPAKGDIIYYPDPGHVGLVVDVVNGIAHTVEGNTKTHPWYQATVNPYSAPWTPGYRFSRPNYSATSPAPTDQADEMEIDLYIRRASTGVIGVFGADYRAVTGGSAGYHAFATADEYNAWRSVLSVYNSEIDRLGLDPRGKKFVPPAGLADVLGVDENGWAVITRMYGV